MKNKIKEIKRLLFEFFDAESYYREQDSYAVKCKNYELYDTIKKLVYMEKLYCLGKIEDIIRELLPEAGGNNFIINKLRTVRWTSMSRWDLFDMKLIIRCYEKDCQEYMCLIKAFIEVGTHIKYNNIEEWTELSERYFTGDTYGLCCGYDKRDDFLYIDFDFL